MIIEIPLLEDIKTKIEGIERVLLNQNIWLTKEQFCQKFDIPNRTFQQWRSSGEIVTKKIGKHVFVNVNESLK